MLVKKGDALSLIAKKYGMTVTQLKSLNGLIRMPFVYNLRLSNLESLSDCRQIRKKSGLLTVFFIR
ncbi:LysM peptidoglycan-binding domain-containing protein [Bacillus sp. ISL-77]|nr:LysM peptidoglycan-binding domain-containing protein [Bacillus sp. ISL-77]